MSEPIPTPEDPNPPEWPTDPTLPDEDGTPPSVEEPEPTPEPEAQPGWAAYADTAADAAVTEAVTIAGRLVPRNMDRPPTVEDGADLPAGTGWNQYNPTTNDLVQMWRWDGSAWVALDMDPQMIPVLDIGSATVGDLTADRINGGHFTGETFTGGAFVGGEFRTSDTLPGQVTLADNAFNYFGVTGPGLSIEPTDPTGYTSLPGIGPADGGVAILGGESGEGSSGMAARPGVAQSWAYGADGSYSQTYTASGTSRLERFSAEGTLESRIEVLNGVAGIMSVAGGMDRHIRVDGNGIRIGTAASGAFKWHNLEYTAQDSGWQPIPTVAGVTGSASLAWRNKGGVIWFRGTVTGDWVSGFNTVAENLDASIWPDYAFYANATGESGQGVSIAMANNGRISLVVPSARSSTISITAMSYPVG